MSTVESISDVFSALLFVEHGKGFLSAVLPVGSALEWVPAGLKFDGNFLLHALGAIIGRCALILRLGLEWIRTGRWVFKCRNVVVL